MSGPIQRSLFEDDYLVRSLGEIAYRPETAISELVANAWDAGAASVIITIPKVIGEVISVNDDGIGLNEKLFMDRWMRLGYKRVVHQGEWAEFPRKRSNSRRKAYGRNGQGRHALLCFGDKYFVDTLRDGESAAHRFTVEPSTDDSPFDLTKTEPIQQKEHGTRVWTIAAKNLPTAESIAEAMSLAFLSDPNFSISVNGDRVSVESFEIIDQEMIDTQGRQCTIRFLRIPGGQRGKTGVAFWVGNRLVGQPSYQLFGTALVDGRSTVAKNHFVVVQSDDLFDHVKPDWSGFKRTDEFLSITEEVASHVNTVAARLNKGAIDDTKKLAYIENRDGIRKLTPLGKAEVKEFVDGFVERVPGINSEILAAGIAAAVNLEQSRSGQQLLSQLASVGESEIEQLAQLLNEWTVKDAMAVLDEIGRRLATVEAIKKLKGDAEADELHTIHPLVAQSRWLFGPEFDSPHFLSNTTIRAAAEKVFKRKIDKSQIENPRQRPDLVFARDATLGLTGVDEIDRDSQLSKLDRLLLIELKRGDATIVLKHIQQAEQYIQELLNCGLLDGSPYIRAFVVGFQVDPKLSNITKMGDPEIARIQPVTFDQLVRTAEARLFGLSKSLETRFRNTPAADILDSILGTPEPTLFENDSVHSKQTKKPQENTNCTTPPKGPLAGIDSLE